MVKKRNNRIRQITNKFAEANVIVLLSHTSPDGDTIGSMLALGYALESVGKKVYYYNPDFVPGNLKFLPGSDKIKDFLPDLPPDIMVYIDCAEGGRSAVLTAAYTQGTTVINIDHHISNTYYGNLNYVEPDTAATGEIIYKLLKKMYVPITKDIAINLYTGIVTDTGRFSYSNTTPDSLKIASELVKAGLNLAILNDILFEQKSLSQINLFQRALNSLEISGDGKISVLTLTKDDFEETGAEPSLSDGFVNYARNIDKVEVSVLFKEFNKSGLKVSFRSNEWLT
jgi:phosphoesterase RecJ-like protein